MRVAFVLSPGCAFLAHTHGIIYYMSPEDELQIDSDGSTPESEFDDWFTLTHKNTKASWDVAEADDSDEVVQDDYSEQDALN